MSYQYTSFERRGHTVTALRNVSTGQFASVDEARTTLDEVERTALWRQAEEMAMEEAPMIPFGYDQYLYLVKPNVTGFTANYHGPIWFMNVEVQQ